MALLLVSAAGAWDLFLSASQGYTHYRAEDLNKVLVLMEETTQEQGFNPYHVRQFDGHLQKALVLGWRKGSWRLGVETEFWVERFHQAEVPFDLEEAGREYRITCDTLRNPAYQTSKMFGCVDARETFTFLPITLQASYGRNLGGHFRAEAGYGLGIMAGSATIELGTEYFGKDVIPDDHVRFDVWPGINPVHKVWTDLEWLPWRFLGLAARFGWRHSLLRGFELRNKQGQSRIFDVVFPEAGENARLYIQTFPDPGIPERIFVGTEAVARSKAAHDGTGFHLVQGDFTGWLVALKMNLYWRDL